MKRKIASCLAVILMLSGGGAHAAPASTGFGYQGSLRDGGGPANGLYDLRFTLWDAAVGGTQIGSSVALVDVPVARGFFDVELDFGPGAWAGDARWLEVTVDGTVLSPRQPVTSTPRSLSTRGVEVDANGRVGIGGSPSTFAFDVAGSAHVAGPLAVNHTSPTEQLDVNGSIMARSSLLAGYPFTFFRASANADFVGIGNTANAPITGSDLVRISDTTNDGFVGMYVDSGTDGEPFYGYARDGSAKAYHYMSGDEWRLHIAGSTRFIVRPTGFEAEVPGDFKATGQVNAADLEINTAGVSLDTNPSSVSIVNNSTTPTLLVTNFSGGEAARFDGDVTIFGQLGKAAGTFIIDHPLDPPNMYLRHSFVESPDMMNVYNGNVTTDADGRAEVVLPDYFEALNRDFRYQLTTIGSFARAMVEREIEGNHFTIRTDEPNVKVSWQVTGVRDDAYARMHPIVVEQEKPADERGLYMHPDAFGLGPEHRIGHAEH